MPEARDRLSRPDNEVAEIQILRRRPVGILGVLVDDDDSDRSVGRTPFRWGATPLTGGGGSGRPAAGDAGTTIGATTIRGGGGGGRGLFGTPRTVYRRGGRNQNTPPSGGGFRRGRGGRSGQQSVLPSWYPRTPLGDITHVVQAIERRRVRLGDVEGRIMETPTPIRIYHQPAANDPSPSDAQLEHDASLVTPKPKLALKACKPSALGKVPKILADIANQGGAESELLTPQKKLLNSIDIVEKVVMEELHRLKRTPSAKKAEREKRVRTLMSMR
ncbi:hypothetical protein OSB04_020757 [Centaurea solstitialis]|uniref:Protein POLYCHOME n=1 Tax=Centaurea solstitialis TaxID=347529 RepID=A0AA38SUI0_9ASTR|nr:hypothetical protein OSB04_020757 [Centaurea solstitialis]